MLWAVSEKVGSLKQQLDDLAYPQITYRRGRQPRAAAARQRLARSDGCSASEQWDLPPACIAEEYGQPESAIRDALAFYGAHRAEIDASLTAEEALERRQSVAES
jgi:hypothetical protein